MQTRAENGLIGGKAYCKAGLLASAALTVMLATPAAAQVDAGDGPTASTAEPAIGPGPTAAAEEPALEQIVVTAQKRAENLQDVPIAISAFSAQALERQNQRDISDLTGRVPSLMITAVPAGPGAAAVSLRGIFFQDIEKSFEPGVGVVVDGVYLSTNTGQLVQSFDFERIEVLRGPQGTLFGKNTTGGALNIVRTRPDPSETLKGKARVTVGSFGRNDYELVVSAPLIQDKLAAKVAFFSLNDRGSWRNTTLDKNVFDKNYQAYVASLRFTPTSDIDLQITYDHVDDDSQVGPLVPLLTPNVIQTRAPGLTNGQDRPCFNPTLPGICDQRLRRNTTVQNLEPRASYKLDAITFNGRFDVGSIAFALVTGYRESEEFVINDQDASQYDLFRTFRPQNFRQFSQEARVETQFDGPFNFVTGAYFFDSFYALKQSSRLDVAAINPAVPLGTTISNTAQRVSQHSESVAIFFQGDYEITDQLTLTVGARQTWDHKRFKFQTFAPGTTFPVDTPVTSTTIARAKFDELTPRVAVRYEITPDINVYASYSRGYNTGGFNGRAPSAALIGPYQPEILDAYEAGFKAELFDRRVRVNGAVFQNNFKDKQEEVIVQLNVAPFTGTTVQNAAKARYRGAELEVTAVPVERLTINATAGYLDAEFRDFVASLRPGTPIMDYSHLRLRRAPKWTLSSSIDYGMPVGPGELGFNATARHIGSFELHILNDPRGRVPATTFIDAALRYEWTMNGLDLRGTAFVKNLTNKTPLNTFTHPGPNGFVDFGAETLRRNWGLELQLRF